MSLGEHNGVGERLAVVCDHYLDLAAALRDSEGRRAIWACPACGKSSFEASFEEGVVGCVEEGCEVPVSMGLPELVAYLDEDLEVGDERGTSRKFTEILEASVRGEQEREAESKEQRRRVREERYWQKGLARARAEELYRAQEELF